MTLLQLADHRNSNTIIQIQIQIQIFASHTAHSRELFGDEP